MKDFYRLLNYEISENIIPLIFICIGKIVFPLILLRIALEDYSTISMRFEDIYASSGCIILFLIGLAGVFALCIKSLYSKYYGSKSIYTLLTLPVKREIVYFSRLAAFLIYFLLFLAFELISVFIGYRFVISYISTLTNEKNYLITNGLFLAFVRSDFLRIILPLGIESLIYSISILISIVCGLYYAVLCERSKRYWGFVLIGIVVFILIRGIVYPITHMTNLDKFKTKYIYSLPLIGFSVLFIWDSIRLVKGGAIT